jgi:hypothetical protein
MKQIESSKETLKVLIFNTDCNIPGFEVHETFGDYLVFSDEVTFYLSRKTKKNNVRILGSEQPHVRVQVTRDSSKVNVFLMRQKQNHIAPSLGKLLSSVATYLDMLEQWL